jgi:hypothetical protein
MGSTLMRSFGRYLALPDAPARLTRSLAVASMGPRALCGCLNFSGQTKDLEQLEPLGFPNTKNDDQVDSVTQALLWIRKNRQNQMTFVVPFVYSARRRYFGDFPDIY